MGDESEDMTDQKDGEVGGVVGDDDDDDDGDDDDDDDDVFAGVLIMESISEANLC